MTRITLLITFLIGLPVLIHAQKSTVKLRHEVIDQKVTLFATNTTETPYEYTFEFELQNLKKIEGYETTQILAGEEVAFIRFEVIDVSKRWRYNSKYRYIRYFPKGVFAEIAEQLKIDEKVAKESIIVFDKDGCSRCVKTLSYMERKKIPHYVLNISEDRTNDELMWAYLKENNVNLSTITTPVILIEENLYFNISNLTEFMQGLKKYRTKKSPD